LALAAGLALPSTATATTAISYDPTTGVTIGTFNHVRDSKLRVLFFVSPDKIQIETQDPAGTATRDGLVAGTGCNKVTDTVAQCSLTGVKFITADLGGGNDEYQAAGAIPSGVGDSLVSGGAGDDTLIGSSAFDSLNGGDGNDRLAGACGDDLLRGGTGNDVFDQPLRGCVGSQDTLLGEGGNDTLRTEGFVTSPDRFEGGRGTDTADYSARFIPVFLSNGFSLIPNDGSENEGDNLVDVERLIGGSVDDTLTASGSTPGILVGGLGVDTLKGGPNSDQILSRDGIADTVDCGGGTDIGELDLRDVGPVATCESGGVEDRREGPGVRIKIRSSVAAPDGLVVVRLACPRAARQTCAGTLRARGRATGPRSRYRIRRGRAARVPVTLSRRDRGRRARVRVTSLERGRHGPKTRWTTIRIRP
jgi:hypothetical protein